MTRDTLSLGPTPAEESCEQLGANYDSAKARAECRCYIAQLRRVFGAEPDGARLRVTSNPHDFGSYLEVAVQFDSDSQVASEYAYKVESDGPTTWDTDALSELAAMGYAVETAADYE